MDYTDWDERNGALKEVELTEKQAESITAPKGGLRFSSVMVIVLAVACITALVTVFVAHYLGIF